MNWLKKSSARGIDEPQLPQLTERERYRLAKPPSFRNSSIDLRNVSERSTYRSPSAADEIRDRDPTPDELRQQLREEIFGREGSHREEGDGMGDMSAYLRRRTSNISRSPSVESQHKSPASSTTRVDSVLGGSTSQLSLATESGRIDLDNAINLLKELSKTLPAEDLIKLHKALLPNIQSEKEPSASKEKVIRRRSLAQPGLATRNTYGEAVRIATTSSSEDLSTVRPMFRAGMFSQSAHVRLSSIESVDERESISPRAQTPADFEYGHLGAHKIGSLVVTNGRAATPDPAWMLSGALETPKSEEDNVAVASAEQDKKFGGVTPFESFTGNEYFPAVPPRVYELECPQSTIQSPTAEEYQAELQGNPFAQQFTHYIPYRPAPASHADLRDSSSRFLVSGSAAHDRVPLSAIPMKMQRPVPDKADSGYSSLHSYHRSEPNLHMESDDKSVYPDDEVIMQSIEEDEVPLPPAEIRPRRNSLLRTITSKKKLNRQSMPEIVPEKSEKSPEPTAAKPAPKRLQKTRPASHAITVQGNRPVKTEIPPVPAIIHKSFLSRVANKPDMEHLHRTLAQSSTSHIAQHSEADIPRYEVKLRFPTAKDDSASETDTIIRPNSGYFATPRDSVSPPPQSAPAPAIKLDLPRLEPMDFEQFAQSSGSYIGGSPYDIALQALTGEKPEAVVSRGPNPEPSTRPPPQRPAIIQLTPKEPEQKVVVSKVRSPVENVPTKPAAEATRKVTPTIESESNPDPKTRPDPAKRWSTDRTKLAERALARRNSLYGSRSSSPEKAESLSRTSSIYSYRESEDPHVSPQDFIATAAPPRPRSRSRSRSKSGEPEIPPPSVPSLPSPAEIKKLTKKASRISKDLTSGSAASSPGSKRSSLQGSPTSARPSPPRARASVESFRGRQQSRPSFSSETPSLQAPAASIAEEPSLPPRSVSPSMASMLSQWEAKSSEPRHEPVRNPSLLSSRPSSIASRKEDVPANWQGPSKLWRQRRKSIGESLISKFKPKPVIPTVVVSRYMTPTQDEFPPWVPTEARMRATSGPFAPPPMLQTHVEPASAENKENQRPALRRPMSLSSASSVYSVNNSSGDIPILDRYGGGLAYDYEHGRGFGGSAGTRQYRSEASRKSQGASKYYGVDLSDVPVIMSGR